MTVHRRRGGPDVPMEQWVMAAKEELYAKVTPRRQRQNRPNTIKHGSTLDVLLSMGFPKTRAWVYAVSHTAHTIKHCRADHQQPVKVFLYLPFGVNISSWSAASLQLEGEAASLLSCACLLIHIIARGVFSDDSRKEKCYSSFTQ